MLYGLDHSAEMIALTRKINKTAISQNRLHLIQDSIMNMVMPDNSFDLITALETVQFWDNTYECFSKIYRLLRPGGKFTIINRYPAVGSNWWKSAKLKNDKEYISALKQSGFGVVAASFSLKKGWITVEAVK